MKEQTGVDVSLVPQLDEPCGLDMHKDRSFVLFFYKDGGGEETSKN